MQSRARLPANPRCTARGRSLLILPCEAAAYTLLLLLIEYRRAVLALLALLAPCISALLGQAYRLCLLVITPHTQPRASPRSSGRPAAYVT